MNRRVHLNIENRDWFRIENADTDEATVYLYDEIGFFGTYADEFVKQLYSIEADVINVHINSPGGSVFEGVTIYNALKNHPSLIAVHIDGLAASQD